MTPARSIPRGGRRHWRAGYAFLLVVLVSFVAMIALSIVLVRQAEGRQAMQRQIDGYKQIHAQNGLRELTEVWSNLFKVNDEKKKTGGVIGYDVVVQGAFGGGKMEVRLKDVQGTVRRRTVDGTPEQNEALNLAAETLLAKGAKGTKFTRLRGPAQVSLNSAPREVLEAIALAVDPSASASAFSAAVLEHRRDGRIQPNEVRTLLQATGLPDTKINLLEKLVSAEPGLWAIEATVLSAGGTVIDRQGGLIVGAIKTNLQNMGISGWTILTWGALADGEHPGEPGREDGADLVH